MYRVYMHLQAMSCTLAREHAALSCSVTYALRLLSLTYSSSDMSHLFRSVLVPVLLYCSPTWCNIGATELAKLQALANRAGRLAGTTIDVKTAIQREVHKLFVCAMSKPAHPMHTLIPIRSSSYPSRRARLPSCFAHSSRLNNHFLSVGVRLFNST